MDVYVAFDLETTGLSPDKGAHIIEIAAIKFDRFGREIGRFSTLVNPGVHIPDAGPHEPGGMTGIRDGMVKLAPNEQEAVSLFKAFAGNAQLVGHNCDFDLGFLAAVDPTFAGRPLQDTIHIARFFLPGLKSYSLINLIRDQHLDRFHTRPHRAWSDAYATARLFFSMNKAAEALPAADLEALRQRALDAEAKDPKPSHASLVAWSRDVVRGDGATPAAPSKSFVERSDVPTLAIRPISVPSDAHFLAPVALPGLPAVQPLGRPDPPSAWMRFAPTSTQAGERGVA